MLYKGKPVRINGEILYEYEKSDRLLMFLLEKLAPDKYKRRVENTMVWDGRLDSIPKEQLPTVIDNLMRQAFGEDPTALEAGRRQVMIEAGVQIVDGEFVELKASE